MAPVRYLWLFAFLAVSFARKTHHGSPNVGIVGGQSVSIEQVPFMASLRLNGTYHWCGGSIIHEQFILTAAHCILYTSGYKVQVGTDLIDTGGQLYDVEKIIKHEQYSAESQDFDICLIKLSTPLVFGPKVAKIEIANADLKIKRRSLLEITGWGNTAPDGTVSSHLLQVKIPTVSWRMCQLSYFPYQRRLTPRMLCAGGNGKDSCQGDSGGPLTYENKQVGLSSFGAGCGDLPGVYTKTSVLLPWINEKIQENTNTKLKNKQKNKSRKKRSHKLD